MEMEHETVDLDSDLCLKINEELSANNVKNSTFAKSYKTVLQNSDMCASLNNADRLRYFVNKIQKEINPQIYRLLGVVYNYSHNIDNFCDYVKRLYLSFKRVAAARVFTNSATTIAYQKIFQSIFDLVLELTGSPIQFKHIHETGWSMASRAGLNYQALGG
ncbi:hypothetical protein RhiirB3_455532 [Rhizophagus irregularis]|nr:hypothetical protein RhiirB3_455532 [Rhizophagus irregularis]